MQKFDEVVNFLPFSGKKMCLHHVKKIKALLGMLARLPWGKRDMLGSIDREYGGVHVEYVSLIVSCYSLRKEGNCIWEGGWYC